MAGLEALAAQDKGRDLATSQQAMSEFCFAHRVEVDGGGGYVTTGLPSLDRLLGGGLVNGGLYVLAARPGMGKTALALQLADHMAQTHGGVLYVSLEMDLNQLSARRLARVCGLPIHRLLMDKLSQAEYAALTGAAEELSRAPLYLNRGGRAGVAEVERLARQVPRLACIVVDYFGLLHPASERAPRYEAMTQVSGALKALARSRGVPVLCLAQLNRELTQRRGCRPQLSDLRDTGALEQDADGVLLLHRPDYYQTGQSSGPGPLPMELLLAKNRHGATGVCPAWFLPHLGRILAMKPTGETGPGPGERAAAGQ